MLPSWTAAKRKYLPVVCAVAILVACAVVGTGLHTGGDDATDASVDGGSSAGTWTGQTPTVPVPGSVGSSDAPDIVDASAEVLERYEETEGCTLVYAGYLDLFGNVWACVVMGPGWAELSVVRSTEGGDVRTSVARIDNAGLAALGGEAP